MFFFLVPPEAAVKTGDFTRTRSLQWHGSSICVGVDVAGALPQTSRSQSWGGRLKVRSVEGNWVAELR